MYRNKKNEKVTDVNSYIDIDGYRYTVNNSPRKDKPYRPNSSSWKGPTIGPQGPIGPKGDQGDPGPVDAIKQPFFNSNIKGTQIIPKGDSVKFPHPREAVQEYYANGIDYDGFDTFTITAAGLYSLTCVLSLNGNNPPDNYFYIEINKVDQVAGSVNLGTVGQVVLTQVGYYRAGTTLRIVNGSNHDVMLSNSSQNISSTGHLSLFRFGDE
ncbi:MAG: hypothetical protein FWE02_03170 [Defluviitaleaceae bacterium]|nr:hypothetical protein [Defluviitaleaceae bacterium]